MIVLRTSSYITRWTSVFVGLEPMGNTNIINYHRTTLMGCGHFVVTKTRYPDAPEAIDFPSLSIDNYCKCKDSGDGETVQRTP